MFSRGRPTPTAVQGVRGGCRWCLARKAPEERIVWVEDVERLDYVRESSDSFSSRVGRPARRRCPGRLVGYSELRPEAEGSSRYYRSFRRRLFWLKPYDRDSGDPTYRHGCPAEGVDPRTVAPNVRGQVTERAWGGPLKQETG
jgi:hypothetical protein